jgi:hypothetical protein
LTLLVYRFRELDALKRPKSGDSVSSSCSQDQTASAKGGAESNGFKIPDVPKPAASAGEEIEDWTMEVRPSMRKLRQGMDSLLKTSRLLCSVLRLQQLKEAVRYLNNSRFFFLFFSGGNVSNTIFWGGGGGIEESEKME